MTLSGGGPAAHDLGSAAPDAETGPSRRAAPSPVRRLQATLALARIEASLLVRSLLVLGGLLAGAAVVWEATQHEQPLWWNAAWQLGYGQQVLSMTVLVAAQLATGRARRDDLQDLYASFPTPTGTRTRAQLVALVGAAPASLLLIGAATAALVLRGAFGTPSPAVLIGGVLLVLAGAAVGVAVGARFPHPLAGVLAALLWLVAIGQSNQFNSAVAWLFPWNSAGGPLGSLPAPLAGDPPAAAHAVELAGIAGLAAAVALAVTAGRRWQRARLAGVGAVAVAVACLAGAVQLRPIPTAGLDRLAEEVADPAAVQHCTTIDQVRYCLYPGFGSLLPALRSPVDGVLAHLPARPAQPLTVRQVANVTFDDPNLTYGHTKQQITRWVTQTQTAPGNAPAASAVYPVVGSWPAGARLAAARFDVALGAAEWAVGLPPTTGNEPASPVSPQCVPVDQAREAIAIWLAILATHPSTPALQAGLPGLGGQGSYTLVGDTPVATWLYPGEDADYLASPGPQTTADGYLLAQAMTAVPVQHVEQVLDQGWTQWLDPHTSNAALAAALGIPLPTFPIPPMVLAHPPGPPGPSQPVCTR